jgi:CheY-like chemotaxis protein
MEANRAAKRLKFIHKPLLNRRFTHDKRSVGTGAVSAEIPADDGIGKVDVTMNRQKILIVDDNPVIVKTMSMKLAKAGYEIVSAVDGSEAIAATRKEKPDLILLDINFPPDVVGLGWDGFKVIAWLRRVDEARGTPLIVISGGDATKLKTRAIEEGAIAYFQKPVNNDELLATIKQAIATSAKPAQDSAK